MTGEWVLAALSFIFSFLVELFPGLSDAWEEFEHKSLTWFVGCFLVPFVAMLLTCYAGISFDFECIQPWYPDAVVAILRAGALAFVSGQAPYLFQKYAGIGKRLKFKKLNSG